ncbi:MAG: F0F1 ATP synthase subunit A, partial [Desulfobacterales bacterium]
MEDLGRIHQIIVPFFGHNMTFNLEVMIMTWIVIFSLLCFGFLATKKKSLLPGPLQVVGELFVVHLFALTEDALGEELSKKYAPLICALFMFL